MGPEDALKLRTNRAKAARVPRLLSLRLAPLAFAGLSAALSWPSDGGGKGCTTACDAPCARAGAPAAASAHASKAAPQLRNGRLGISAMIFALVTRA